MRSDGLHGPSSAYTQFTYTGTRDDLDLARGYVYHTWLPRANVGLACPLELEHHGHRSPVAHQDPGRWHISIPIRKKEGQRTPQPGHPPLVPSNGDQGDGRHLWYDMAPCRSVD
jgi:hypothetical protein